MVILNQGRSLGTLAFLAAQTALKTQPWRAVPGQISLSSQAVSGQPVTLNLQAPGVDLSTAKITWEVQNQDPTFGQTFTFTTTNMGSQWVEAEAQLPDGRRVFAIGNVMIGAGNAPIPKLNFSSGGATLSWASAVGGVYRITYKNNLTDPNWITLSGNISASSTFTTWTDSTARSASRRFYQISRIQ